MARHILKRKPLARHPHKGSWSRLKNLENIPLVYMTDTELEDVLFSPGARDELLEAREGRPSDGVVVAAILRLPNGDERVLMETFEYGDGEGIDLVDKQIRQFRKHLLPGESIQRKAWRLDWPQALRAKQ